MSKEIDWSKAPEAATHYQKEADIWYKQTHEAYQWDCGEWIKLARSDLGEYDLRGLVERPAPAEWTGTGLPPVGTVCEFYDDSSSVDWREGLENGDKVKILAHYSPLGDGDLVAVFCYEIEGGKLTDQAVADCFRPIRTPEQIAAEEREKAVLEIGTILINNRGSCNEYHLDGLLHDAGYRKTEAGK